MGDPSRLQCGQSCARWMEAAVQQDSDRTFDAGLTQ
jgi:hypothetical protein